MDPQIAGGNGLLGGGQLLAAISTRIVATLREHYGRGPLKAKTYFVDDMIIVVMRGSGFTPLERTLIDDGGADRVVAMRHEFQRAMRARYEETIEELTGCKVVGLMSQTQLEPDIMMETFFVDGPLEGLRQIEDDASLRIHAARVTPTR